MTWLLAFAFFIGLGYFVVKLVIHSTEWAQKPMNAHISVTGLAQAGDILDRNGTVLATSDEDGNRLYHDDYSTRCALLHAVGDDSVNISTALQSVYRTGLTGYNYFLGLGLPQSFRSSSDIQTTLDAPTCAAAYNAMAQREYKGACVIYNYKTGEIICDVSTPGYDPYDPVEIKDGDDTYDGVYLDNAISSTYPPGSTFKLITAAAAIENIPNAETRKIYCNSYDEISGDVVTCGEVHGEIDMKEAMAQSCNIYFAKLAVELGPDVMTEYAEKFGYNRSFEIDSNTTAMSQYNVKDAKPGTEIAALAESGFGQYTNMANPMHQMIIAGAIANGGTPIQPYMVENVTSVFDFDKILPGPHGKHLDKMIESSTAATLSDMMKYTIDTHYSYTSLDELHVAAKTGTAEVITATEKFDDGWIVGFVTDEDCPLAFAVCIERGGFGIDSAGAVIAETLPTAKLVFSDSVNNY